MSFEPQIQSAEEFEREVEGLLDTRTPGPAYRTQFGAIPYRDRRAEHGRKHEWLIKGVLTRGEQGMLLGHSQTGKSFFAIDLGMSIARGAPWFGRKVRRGLVIYHAGESAKGVRDKRLPAYDKVNGLQDVDDLPFVLLTLPLDLYSSDDDTNKLIAECRYWQAQYSDFQLELFVIDTFNAATPGADENAGKDVGSIRRRCKQIEMALGCAVLLVHHKNAAGTKHRGHSSMFADVENVLDLSMVTTTVSGSKDPIVLKDIHGRKVREAVITKLKDGEDGVKFRFTLNGVTLGEDEDGEAITSCVIGKPDMGDVEPSDHEKATAGKPARLPGRQYALLKVIEQAIRDHGRTAPPGLPVRNDAVVVEWRHVKEMYSARSFVENADPAKQAAALRQAMKVAGEGLMDRGYIMRDNNWVWRTNKRLPGDRERVAKFADGDGADFSARAGADTTEAWLMDAGASDEDTGDE